MIAPEFLTRNNASAKEIRNQKNTTGSTLTVSEKAQFAVGGQHSSGFLYLLLDHFISLKND
ncbi:MAG: hypothetical protein ACR2PT_09605 [Endozoicomonas sp.]